LPPLRLPRRNSTSKKASVALPKWASYPTPQMFPMGHQIWWSDSHHDFIMSSVFLAYGGVMAVMAHLGLGRGVEKSRRVTTAFWHLHWTFATPPRWLKKATK
jgi:hypothetical protein